MPKRMYFDPWHDNQCARQARYRARRKEYEKYKAEGGEQSYPVWSSRVRELDAEAKAEKEAEKK